MVLRNVEAVANLSLRWLLHYHARSKYIYGFSDCLTPHALTEVRETICGRGRTINKPLRYPKVGAVFNGVENPPEANVTIGREGALPCSANSARHESGHWARFGPSACGRSRQNLTSWCILSFLKCFFFFFFYLISLIADGPHHYHPACGH